MTRPRRGSQARRAGRGARSGRVVAVLGLGLAAVACGEGRPTGPPSAPEPSAAPSAALPGPPGTAAPSPPGLPAGVVVTAALDRPGMPYLTWWVDLDRPDTPPRVSLARGILAYDGLDLVEVGLVEPSARSPASVSVHEQATGRRWTWGAPGSPSGAPAGRLEVASWVGGVLSVVLTGEGAGEEPRPTAAWTLKGGLPVSLGDLFSPEDARAVARKGAEALGASGAPSCRTWDPDRFLLRPHRNDVQVVFVPPGGPGCGGRPVELAIAAPRRHLGIGPVGTRLPGPPPPPAAGADDYFFHPGPEAGFLLLLEGGRLDFVGPDRDRIPLARGVRRIVSVDWVKGAPPADVAAHARDRFAPVGRLRAGLGTSVGVDGDPGEWDVAVPYPLELASQLAEGSAPAGWGGPRDLSSQVKAQVAGGRLALLARVRDEDPRLGTGPGPTERVRIWLGTASGVLRLEARPRGASPPELTAAVASTDSAPPDGTEAAFRAEPGGWVFEAAVPLRALSPEGAELTFALALGDADRGRPPESTLSTAPAWGDDPAALGALRLPGG